jgi:unsaturated chondroitin disaccharide hydrolase
MKKIVFILMTVLLCQGCIVKEEDMSAVIDRGMKVAVSQYKLMDGALNRKAMPKTTDQENNLQTSGINWWCSGFFPGTLWYLYEYTADDSIKKLAQEYTALLEPLKYIKTDHDIGFQLNCSFGNGYRLIKNPAYLKVLHSGACSLASRFNPTVGCIKSWDNNKWMYPVIIDNMMNLELLMNVSKAYNDDSLRFIACKHAERTMENHYRSDYSSFHLVDYNIKDGSVIKKQTVQGLNDSSSWARGQAWGLYGYTMMFRETGKRNFLEQAQNIAKYLINHPEFPKDGIPYWDFSTKKAGDYRDASAAAIMASALIELSTMTNEENLRDNYLHVAETQLRTLSSDKYLSKPGENNYFILKHSVGNLPSHQEVDVPLTYADYYYVEALMRYRQLIKSRN